MDPVKWEWTWCTGMGLAIREWGMGIKNNSRIVDSFRVANWPRKHQTVQ